MSGTGGRAGGGIPPKPPSEQEAGRATGRNQADLRAAQRLIERNARESTHVSAGGATKRPVRVMSTDWINQDRQMHEHIAKARFGAFPPAPGSGKAPGGQSAPPAPAAGRAAQTPVARTGPAPSRSATGPATVDRTNQGAARPSPAARAVGAVQPPPARTEAGPGQTATRTGEPALAAVATMRASSTGLNQADLRAAQRLIDRHVRSAVAAGAEPGQAAPRQRQRLGPRTRAPEGVAPVRQGNYALTRDGSIVAAHRLDQAQRGMQGLGLAATAGTTEADAGARRARAEVAAAEKAAAAEPVETSVPEVSVPLARLRTQSWALPQEAAGKGPDKAGAKARERDGRGIG